MNTTIDQHISDLLYYHECVVVPGFGAFLTRDYNAEVNAATNMLRPPSKRVAFNARINENDGLLAKHVAKVEGVSYKRALDSIEISVRSWQRILSSGKKINLFGVGRLFKDEEGLLQFNPAHDINYNTKSYGLTIFRATAMERDQKIKRSVNKAIENHKNPSGQKITNTKPETGKKKNWVLWAAVLGPVAALLLVGSYYYINERDKFDQAAGYVTSPFNQGEEDATAAEASMVDSLNTEEELEDQDLPDEDKTSLDPDYEVDEENYTTTDVDESYNKSLYNIKDRPAGAEEEESYTAAREEQTQAEPTQAAPKDEPVVANGDFDYQIIVGAFGEADNADNYVQNLKNRGFDAYVAGRSGNYSRVAIGRYSSKNTAMDQLQKIREQVNYNAWLNHN